MKALNLYNIIGRRFASPVKPGARADRVRGRDEQRFVKEHSITPAPSSSNNSRSVTPATTVTLNEVDSSVNQLWMLLLF